MFFDVTILSSETIDSFSEYIPEELCKDIDNDDNFGWGLSKDDDVAGCGLFSREGDEVEILWLYVEPILRGQGIGRDLLNRAMAEAIPNRFVCRYLMPTHELFGGFLRHEGFYVHPDHSLEDESVLDGDTLFIGYRDENSAAMESPDDRLLFRDPGMALLIPRFKQLELFFDDNYDDAVSVYDDGTLPYIDIERDGCHVRFFIMPESDSDNDEAFMITARASVDVSKADTDKAKETLDSWAKEHPLISGEYNEAKDVVDFFAAYIPDNGMPDEAFLGSFTETILADVTAFDKAMIISRKKIG